MPVRQGEFCENTPVYAFLELSIYFPGGINEALAPSYYEEGGALEDITNLKFLALDLGQKEQEATYKLASPRFPKERTARTSFQTWCCTERLWPPHDRALGEEMGGNSQTARAHCSGRAEDLRTFGFCPQGSRHRLGAAE